jgi:NADPH:quinone reductase-like Zn-dependent oxidoreductase
MTFKEGAYAEYVSAKEEWLAHCPKSLPLHEAGQVPACIFDMLAGIHASGQCVSSAKLVHVR